EELTVEMLALEPRASDDETLESEASIGTADSSENLNVDSEETISDFSERGARMSSPWPSRSDGKDTRRRAQHQQSDSLDSADSCSTVSSYSSSSHFYPSPSSSAASRRFRFHSKSPAVGSSPARSLAQPLDASHSSRSDSFDGSPTGEQDIAYDERPLFTSRGTYNPEKGKQKLKAARHSGGRNVRDGGGDPPDISQHLVLYGFDSNPFADPVDVNPFQVSVRCSSAPGRWLLAGCIWCKGKYTGTTVPASAASSSQPAVLHTSVEQTPQDLFFSGRGIGIIVSFLHGATLFLNVLACLAYFTADAAKGVDFGLSILWFILFTPVSFVCWYRPVYKAFRYALSLILDGFTGCKCF
ncbi:hypothetical protein GOODEAATRI_006346, partial [Goodea atripinnis]